MSVRLFGTRFSTAPAAEALAAAMSAGRTLPRLIVTANVDHIVLLSQNPAFRKAYRDAAVRTLDGTPLVWIARLSGAPGACRVTGHDLLASALAGPADPARRVFLVCSCEAVAERVAARFVATGLAPEAVRCAVPPFGFEHDEAYAAELAQAVRAHGTGLLVLGVGAPKSEVWVDRHAGELGDPIVLAIGEALNVVAGLVPRAPPFMQRLGLEWLFRFAHAPRRLFRRYFIRSWRFLAILATARGRGGLLAPGGEAEALPLPRDAVGSGWARWRFWTSLKRRAGLLIRSPL